MLLNDYGNHVQLNSVDNNGDPERIFPTNTADDVVVNENANTLSQFLTILKPSSQLDEDAAMNAEESELMVISDSLATAMGIS